jgi:autotransporter-associated beta strand protein/parallel beta-helix repeat protein
MKNHFFTVCLALATMSVVSGTTLFAGPGVQRLLYTVPNSTFIESSADTLVNINDASGSISILQTAINNARTANPGAIITIRLLSGATYWVSNSTGGLVLGSQECLVGTGATIAAADAAVTNTLITIASGSTNVAIAGGTLNAGGANIFGIFAPAAAARVNIDKVTVLSCGQDCIQLNGTGSGTFDNEMTVTRCDVSGSPGHSGISLWNATQTTCVDNNCHNNSVGIWLGNCSYGNIANNTCESNSVGIDFSSGTDDYLVNNTCNFNGTGIVASGAGGMMVSDVLAGNTVAAIHSSGSGNIYCDNLFGAGNATNFLNGGSGDDVVAYKGSINGLGQNYFYPPLIDDQHTTTIINGMGRYDLTDNSTTTIDAVQSEYNAAVNAYPGDVIVLHLNGNYTVGANPLTLASDTCVLLGGTIQINSSTSASYAITAPSGSAYISISGGTIDGGTASPPAHGRDAIYFSGVSMFQIDSVTMQNFGNNTSRVGGSDVVRIDHGNTPRIVTRCTINGGSARGIWLATSGPRDIVSDNTVTNVQMDGVDCDESTSASVVKFNYLSNNARYGVFLEQSASDNLVLGNICNYDHSFGIGCYNNSATPRGATAYNSVICNSILGDNGLRNGSTGDGSAVTSSDNFFFDNTVMNANIQSQLYGSQNYYSQNYLGNSSLSTSGSEVFFNSPDVNGDFYLQDNHSGLDAIVPNAATTSGAPIITASAAGLSDGEWQLLPTDSGYYQLINQNSGLALVVQGAATNNGAGIIQWTYNASGNDEWMPVPLGNGLYDFVNRLSGLDLAVPGASTVPGTQLVQQAFSTAPGQQFAMLDVAPPVTLLEVSNTISWTGGGAPAGNWSNPNNWGGTLPVAGDWLGFGTGSSVLTTNDFPAGTAFANLSFNAAAPAFTLSGNGLVLAAMQENSSGTNSGGGITDASINNQTINLPVTLAAGSHVIATQGGAGPLAFTGALTRAAGALSQFNVSGGAISSGLANVNSIIGGWAVVATAASLVNNNGGAGTVNWAVSNAGNIAGFSGYTTVTGSGASIPNETGNNVNITTDGSSADSLAASGVTDMNTLSFSATANNLQLNIGSSQTLRLGTEGGIMANSPRYATVGNGGSGVITAGGGSGAAGELSLYNLSYYSGGGLVINATINDNGAGHAVSINTLGSVNFNYANGYSGGTFINEGELYLQGGATFGSGPVHVFPGGRADFGGNNSAVVTNNFYLSGFGFAAGGEPAALKGTYNGNFTGLISLVGDAQIDPNAGTWPSTCTFSGGLAGSGSLTLGGPNSVVAGIATLGGNCNHTGDTIIDATANANGGSGIFIAAGANNIMNNGGDLNLVGGHTGIASFDLNGTTQTINGLNATNGSPANTVVKSSAVGGVLVVGGNNTDSLFGGVLENGAGTLALIKTGGGTFTLTNDNTYSGNTTINQGTLALSGAGSLVNSALLTLTSGATLDVSGRADQTFTLSNGQTLEGDGTINVNLTTVPGATILPGNPTSLGALNVSGAAQLQGATIMKLNAATGAADQIQAGSFNVGGTLTVTNLSGTLQAGQSFPLFAGGTYAGTFNALNLPALSAGLGWSNSLAANGTLQVMAYQPVFARIALAGSNLSFTGSGGLPAKNFLVLTSTNLALPSLDWTVIATNTFDASGIFNFTNSINPNLPQCFYLLQYQ